MASAIAARIRAGQYTHRLTAERPLAAELGVSYQTRRHGIKLLREQGMVVTRQGRGTFIAPPHPEGHP